MSTGSEQSHFYSSVKNQRQGPLVNEGVPKELGLAKAFLHQYLPPGHKT